MSTVQHFKRGKIKFEKFGGPPGTASIARLITPEISSSMGGGVARFDGCTIEWTVLYDEIIIVLEGKFRLRHGKDYRQKLEAKPGDVVWLPEGTALKIRRREGGRVLRAAPGRLAQAARDGVAHEPDAMGAS